MQTDSIDIDDDTVETPSHHLVSTLTLASVQHMLAVVEDYIRAGCTEAAIDALGRLTRRLDTISEEP